MSDYEKRKIKNSFSPIKMTCLYSLGASESAKVDLTNLQTQLISISSVISPLVWRSHTPKQSKGESGNT